jgi:hypothetical protein
MGFVNEEEEAMEKVAEMEREEKEAQQALAEAQARQAAQQNAQQASPTNNQVSGEVKETQPESGYKLEAIPEGVEKELTKNIHAVPDTNDFYEWLFGELSFPGVIVHEFGHYVFALLFGLKIYDVVFYKKRGKDGVLGYVQHERPNSAFKSFFITAGPFILNNIIAFILFEQAVGSAGFYEIGGLLYFLVLLWLGFSIAFHAIPSPPDSHISWYEDYWSGMKKMFAEPSVFLKIIYIITFPISLAVGVFFLLIFTLLRIWWINLMWPFFLFFLASQNLLFI